MADKGILDGTQMIIECMYLAYGEDGNQLYDINELNLSCGMGQGGGSGVSCTVVTGGKDHTEQMQFERAQADEDANILLSAKFKVGERAKVVMKYTIGADGEQPVTDTLIDGKIVSVGREIRSYGTGITNTIKMTIANEWDSFVCVPPGNLYTFIANGESRIVKETNATLRTASMSAALKKYSGTADNKFNVAKLTAFCLDNSGELFNVYNGNSDIKAGKLCELADVDNAPQLRTPKGALSNALQQAILSMLSAGVMSTDQKALFASILETFWMTLVPRLDAKSGKWTMRVIPNNLLDEPQPVDMDEADLVNSSKLLSFDKLESGLSLSQPTYIGVRYSGNKGSTLEEHMILYGEGTQGSGETTVGKLTQIAEVDLSGKTPTAKGRDGSEVKPLVGIIVTDIPSWVSFTAPMSKKENDNKRPIEEWKEQQKQWAIIIAKATYMTRDRVNSTLSFRVPLNYYQTFIDVIGECIAVTLTDTEHFAEVVGNADVYIGRVENVSLYTKLSNDRFDGMLTVTLNGVRTGQEQAILKVDSKEIFAMDKESE